MKNIFGFLLFSIACRIMSFAMDLIDEENQRKLITVLVTVLEEGGLTIRAIDASR